MKVHVSLSKGQPTGLKYFQKNDYDIAVRNTKRFRSYDAMVYMKPKDFLAVAADFRPRENTIRELVTLLRQGGQFDQIPYLRLSHVADSTFQVEGHEGRHRSMAIHSLDPNALIPVRLTAHSTDWRGLDLIGKQITLLDQDNHGQSIHVEVADV